MEWINYHHLLYFWVIYREGSLSGAARQLHLTHSTLSAQLKTLENFLGGQLFDRRGRALVATPLGQQIATYADDIFRLGGELLEVARGRAARRAIPFRVGVVGSLARTTVHQLLSPALRIQNVRPLRLQQAPLDALTTELAAGQLDLVLSDLPPRSTFKLQSHLVQTTPLCLYGKAKMAARYRPNFPHRLTGAPVVMPSAGPLRRSLDRWFVNHGVEVSLAGEFDDAGLMRLFGAAGVGLFPVRGPLRKEVEAMHRARFVGWLDGLVENVYALSIERTVRHPGVAAVLDGSRDKATLGPNHHRLGS